jgi:SAM-dependent methyltransferase
MDLGRIVKLMSSGDTSNRRILEIPTGHELRGSSEALETFQLIAGEVGRMALDRNIKTKLPSIRELERARHAERSRRPPVRLNAQRFWREYVLGREGEGGIKLLTATSAYQDLMATQLERLALRPGDRVVDLGSGTGELAAAVGRRAWRPSAPSIVEVDLITDALSRSRERQCQRLGKPVHVARLAGDLDLGTRFLPLSPCSVDAALASLLISYLRTPEALLQDLMRVVRPGGHVVVSSLRRDADISKIYVSGMAELQPDRIVSLFGAEVASRFEVLQREFLNSAAKLVDLEEGGRFRFFEGDQLGEMVSAAGFVDVTVDAAFGDPPQAFVASARRP